MAYLLGLKRLGHDVYLFEDVTADECYSATYERIAFDEWGGAREFEHVARHYGFWPNSCLIYEGGEQTHGLTYRRALEVAKSADVLFNIGTSMRTQEVLDAVPCAVFIDEAPPKPQAFHFEHGIDQGFEDHDHFFTVGLNVGAPDCGIPTGGMTWHPTTHPVVLDMWPTATWKPRNRFTAVTKWGSKETFVVDGVYSGEKTDNWREFMHLPSHTPQEIELAVSFAPGYEQAGDELRNNGWRVRDACRIRTFDDYRSYIANSKAEFSVANNRYVAFNTGWTSDRTARYLASGRPVLVQSTGCEAHLPTGTGFLTFRNEADAVAGIDEINTNYARHARAAREIAEEYFGAENVMRRILERLDGNAKGGDRT